MSEQEANWKCCGCGAPPPFNCDCITDVVYAGSGQFALKRNVGGKTAETDEETIERLEAERDQALAEVERLKGALEPFAKLLDRSPMLRAAGEHAEFEVDEFIHDNTVYPGKGYTGAFSKADLVRARQALQGEKP